MSNMDRLLPYRDIGVRYGKSPTNAAWAHREVARVVAKFIRAYAPELTEQQALELAGQEWAQLRVRDLVEQPLSKGAQWPTE